MLDQGKEKGKEKVQYKIGVLNFEEKAKTKVINLIKNATDSEVTHPVYDRRVDKKSVLGILDLNVQSCDIKLTIYGQVGGWANDENRLFMEKYDGNIIIWNPLRNNGQRLSNCIHNVTRNNKLAHFLIIVEDKEKSEELIDSCRKLGCRRVDCKTADINNASQCKEIVQTFCSNIHNGISASLEDESFLIENKFWLNGFSVHQYDDRGALWIAASIKSKNCLSESVTLVLSNNNITDKGAEAILEAIKESGQYFKIDLSENKISPDLIEDINIALEINRIIHLYTVQLFFWLQICENQKFSSVALEIVKITSLLIFQLNYKHSLGNQPETCIKNFERLGFFKEIAPPPKITPLSFTYQENGCVYIHYKSYKEAQSIYNKIPEAYHCFLKLSSDEKYPIIQILKSIKLVFPAACRGTLRESLKTGGFQI